MIEVSRILGASVSYLYGETDDPRPAADWHSGRGPSNEAAAELLTALAELEKVQSRIKALIDNRQRSEFYPMPDADPSMLASDIYGNAYPAPDMSNKRAARSGKEGD